MKKKLLIVGAFPPCGSSVVGGVVTICRALLDSNFADKFKLILIDSTQVSNPPPGILSRSLQASVRTLKFFFALLIQRPSAVLLFTAIGASVFEKGLMAWLAKLSGVPVFLFPRGAELIDIYHKSPLQAMWIWPAMRGATHLLCQGPSWYKFAVSELGFHPSKVDIIHNWSASEALLKIGAVRQTKVTPTEIRILFLGWLEKEKGIFELLDACKQLSTEFNYTLSVAGRGRAEVDAKKYVLSNNLQSYVHFLGWVHGSTKIMLLSQSDILVLPSWAEGFPNSIIEAMAAKVSVVATSVGVIPDFLNNREHALIVPPHDPSAIHQALFELMSCKSLRSQLADNAYVMARDTFSLQVGVDRLASVISTAIANSL